MDKELGFLIGATEDGCVYHTKKNEYILEIDQKDLEWLKYIQEVLKTLNKKSSIRRIKKKYFRLVCYSKDIYKIISEYGRNYNKILKQNKDFQNHFVKGIYDAEGSVHYKRYQISLYSINKELILIVKEILKNNDILSGKISFSRNMYNLPIYGKENIKKFKQTIDFRHKGKLKKLNVLVERSNFSQSLKQSRGG